MGEFSPGKTCASSRGKTGGMALSILDRSRIQVVINRLLRRIEEKINLRKRDEIHRNRVENQCEGITLYKS